MDERDWLAERFEEHRSHVRAVAYRMLDSVSEADDAVQEAWLRLSRADTSSVENLGGWLTRVVARVCLDMLRACWRSLTRMSSSVRTRWPSSGAGRGRSAAPRRWRRWRCVAARGRRGRCW